MADEEDVRPTAPRGWYPDIETVGQVRYWDGAQWTQHRAAATVPRRRRRWTWLLVAAAITAGVLWVWGFYTYAFGPGAIARVRGQVTSVRDLGDNGTEVCMDHVTDAGTNYGDRDHPWKSPQCWDGILEGLPPELGACMIMQQEGESSYLRIERATGCE